MNDYSLMFYKGSGYGGVLINLNFTVFLIDKRGIADLVKDHIEVIGMDEV